MATTVCMHNQLGFCKFKDHCRHLHVNEICIVSDCSNKDCQLRHPRSCRYYSAYGACKFGEHCAYQHYPPIQDEIHLIKQELLCLSTKIDNIVKILGKIAPLLEDKATHLSESSEYPPLQST